MCWGNTARQELPSSFEAYEKGGSLRVSLQYVKTVQVALESAVGQM